jgi:hypothetical protein
VVAVQVKGLLVVVGGAGVVAGQLLHQAKIVGDAGLERPVTGLSVQCQRPRRARTAWPELDAETIPDSRAGTVEHALFAAERRAALREVLAHLTPRERQLLNSLTADPPVPYAEISARLGIPVGSIGPSRGRCLAKLRRHPAIAALINADAEAA